MEMIEKTHQKETGKKVRKRIDDKQNEKKKEK